MNFTDAEVAPDSGPLPATGRRFSMTGSGLSASEAVATLPPKKGKEPDIDVARLARAMTRARQVLQYFRVERMAFVKHLVGKHWADNGSEKKIPVNVLQQWLTVVSRNLIAKNPRVMLTNRDGSQRAAVAAAQEWGNQRIEDMYFADELRAVVTDGLISIGIMKVGISSPADAVTGAYVNPVGVPFAAQVDLDDWVHDVTARKFSECSYMGHRFRVPLSAAEELGYDKKLASKLIATSGTQRSHNTEGDERIDTLGRDYVVTDDDEFDPMVELWEIYLPRIKRIVILACDDGGVPWSDQKPLKVIEWFGPACGPYHFLCFQNVPGNAMPKAPGQDLVDLADLVNRLYRKLGRQAEAQKSTVPIRGGAVDDAGNLKQASDGEMFACDAPELIKELRTGGPDQVNMAFAVHVKDLFSEQAGNLKLLSGTSPQSKTAAQDKMLNDNAGAGIADQQETVVTFTAKVLDSLMWFWWNHPELVMKSQRTAGPGLEDISITRQLYPRGATRPNGQPEQLQRSGRYEDLKLRVDPYSMRYRSPQERMQFLMTLVQQFAPLMPLLQQQGILLDAQFLMKKIAEYGDEPDVVQLFTVQEPPVAPEGAGPPDTPGAGGPNGGEYTRTSIGQDTDANKSADMMNEAAAAGAEEQG